ncbi:MAG: hypothetical protein E7L17_14550 [Clostridium sp.]|uniref:hypothetical protein n=1 Tax=Clostridium sp. TaxID=1506 RepID=UPI0029154D78|nr:hypothetical protein [Clostridium sp.]MDU7339320.1 hypothetical protein [Clostridium sp.]
MDNKDIIIRQAAKILELEDELSKKDDQLKSANQSLITWYDRCQTLEAEKTPQGEPNE